MFFFWNMSLARELRSRDNEHNSANDIISAFITKTHQPVITSLIAEVMDAIHDTSSVLSAFDLFNSDIVSKMLNRARNTSEF